MTPASSDACHYLWQTPGIRRAFKTAVSLHSHTHFSRELLNFIPRYARRLPVVSQLVAQQEDRYEELHGHRFDFRRAWWTPPLSPVEAYNLERDQIERELDLRAMVSISDHDDIQAPTLLSVLPEHEQVPISVEWTVPYDASFLHVGVHNLPHRWAPYVMERLSAFTAAPDERDLPELFCVLNGFPSTLVILNHPMWDEPNVGASLHRAIVRRFIDTHREWIHALELNGLRGWDENAETGELARCYGIPLISGGDRHGREPNAVLNLTNASTFAEFADEVRTDRHSQVLYMNQYREPLRYRLMETLLEIVRDYPDLPADRRRWTDRVFVDCMDQGVKRLSSLWEGDGPRIVRIFMGGVRLMESRRVRSALRFALAERQEAST